MAARSRPWRVPDGLWLELDRLIPKPERRFGYPGRKRHDDRSDHPRSLLVTVAAQRAEKGGHTAAS
jgi:hypothetical protein